MRANLSLLLIVGAVFTQSLTGAPLLDILRAANADLPQRDAPMAEWDRFDLKRWIAIQTIAREIVDSNVNLDAFDDFKTDVRKYLAEIAYSPYYLLFDERRLEYAILSNFVRDAFWRLRDTDIPSVNKLLEMSLPKDRPANILFWKRDLKMGQHRSLRHIGINHNHSEQNDRLLLLIHELAHRAQGSLNKVETQFRNANNSLKLHVKLVARHGGKRKNQLEKKVEIWARTGLELQFLNEWRTWVITFDIYRKQLQNPKSLSAVPWERIPWVDQILAQQRANENLKQFVFRYLDERFTDPKDPDLGIKEQVLKRHRIELRKKILRDELSLNELEEVFEAK